MSSFTNIIENFEEQYGVDTTRAALCLGLGLMANNEDDKADLFETVNMFQKSGIPLSPFLSQKSNDRLLSTEKKKLLIQFALVTTFLLKILFCLMY